MEIKIALDNTGILILPGRRIWEMPAAVRRTRAGRHPNRYFATKTGSILLTTKASDIGRRSHVNKKAFRQLCRVAHEISQFLTAKVVTTRTGIRYTARRGYPPFPVKAITNWSRLV